MADQVTRADRPWRIVQAIGVFATVGLLAGLVWRPELWLRLLWNVVIPLVPASLLLSPMVWRNACPLATLNMATNRWATRRRASERWTTGTNALGIVLLALLVPARRFLFNTDGTALAVTVAVVGLGALVLGALFDGRAGFCNALCPVLPVERLYGQRPLLDVGRARCAACTACARACIDLSPGRSLAQAPGRPVTKASWLLTPFGIFAAAFPGFVLAYFTAVDGPLASAGAVYGRIALFSALSYAAVVAAVRLTRPVYTASMRVLAGLAAGIYYWFAAPGIVEALGGPPAVGQGLRIAALALVALWFWRAIGAAGDPVGARS